MHPDLDPAIIAAAYEDGPIAAAAEYGAEFRSDLEGYLAREALEACIVPGSYELLPADRVDGYFGFVDPSGGSADSFTLAVAHRDGERVVLDCVRDSLDGGVRGLLTLRPRGGRDPHAPPPAEARRPLRTR
jgi:hypothetical protein